MVCCFKHGKAITSQPHAHARWRHRSIDRNGRLRRRLVFIGLGANLLRDTDLGSPIGNEPGRTNPCDYLSVTAPGATQGIPSASMKNRYANTGIATTAAVVSTCRSQIADNKRLAAFTRLPRSPYN